MKTRFHKRLSRLARGYVRRTVLSRHGIGILAETRNGLYVVEPGDFGVSRHLLRDGAYDHQALLWLQDALGGGAKTIVVVGAHIGTVLIPLARMARRAIGFEADPENYRLAGFNLLLNQIENVTLVNKAVGSFQGRVGVRRNPINTGNSSIARAGQTATAEVEMTMLDEVLPSLAISDVDLLVIDVEGHERHVLEGGEATLRGTRMLYMEYAPEQLAEHGSNGPDLIDRTFGEFECVYVFNDGVQCFDREQAKAYLDRGSARRGFLVNLLFSKERLIRD